MPNLSDYNPAMKYGANLDVNVDLADIRDANNNELLELDTVTSAVNFVSIANAITGSAAVVLGLGDDTNVGLQLSAKGTAKIDIGNFATASPAQAAGGVLAATINAQRGRITIPNLGVTAGSAVTVNLTNNKIGGDNYVIATIGTNAAATGTPFILRTTSGAGSATIVVAGAGAAAVAGALDVQFIVV